MKLLYLVSTLVLTLLAGKAAFAQDFSNKGKEFYLCFPQHVPSGSNLATLSIFITSDKASSGTISMANGAFASTFNIAANGIQEIQIPWNSLIHISNAESNTVINKSIKIKVDPGKASVVAYAQQWAGARSAATLLLPVNVLGKKYYAISFTQNGTNSGIYMGRSQFQIIAVKDNTVVTITPRKNGVLETPFSITLPLAGDMYQYQSTDANAQIQDLTGTLIESVASGSGGCLPIAVFSGSSNITLGTPSCNGSSYDPLWQQTYPVTTWGKSFGFVPFADYPSGSSYRVLASEDNTRIFFNGILVATLNAGQIYPSAFTSNPEITTNPINITSDKPICVAQYATTQGCSGNNPAAGDPDMVILNPIEQNISDITIFSSNLQSISRQWVNVLMKTSATGSFKLNGAIPSAAWQTFPSLPGYSYLRHLLPGLGAYRLQADSGFNAIAYGWGSVESYAYSAGTNIKDLYTQMGVVTPYGSASSPSVCKDLLSRFKLSVPYQLDSMFWNFNGFQTPNVMVKGPPNPIPYDSITNVNGKQVYWYSLPTPYVYSTPGTYPISITTYTQNTSGCGSEQDISFDVEVYNKPVANFTFTTNGCALNPVNFFDNSILNGRAATAWSWNFGNSSTSALMNPSITYAGQGNYIVKHTTLNDIGCLSDTVTKPVSINNLPFAKFGASFPNCVGKAITFSDSSSVSGGSLIAKWFWDFGDGSPLTVATTNAQQLHTYNTTGSYNVTLKVETSSGCQSLVYTLPMTISQNPVIDFSLPNVCLPAGTAQFNDLSTISGGGSIINWAWNFGDGGISNVPNPVYNYTGVGPYNVTLIVTSNTGCAETKIKALNTIYAEPQAAFTVPSEICYGKSISVTDNSSAAGSTISQRRWDFGDGSPVIIVNAPANPNISHTYTSAGNYTIRLDITSSAGCQTVTKYATRPITVNRLPVSDFNFTNPLCASGSIAFGDLSIPNDGSLINWQWNFGDPGSGAANTSSIQNPSHIFANQGNYNVSLVVTSSKGCVSPVVSKPVVINVLPKAGYIAPQVCLTDPQAPFFDASSVSSGSIVAWNWNFGDPDSGPNNISSLQNPTHTYSTVGLYSGTLIVTTSNGCKDTIAQSFTVNGSVPVSNFTVQNPNILCSNRDVSITNASTVDFGKIIRLEVFWDYANDPTIKTTDITPAPAKIYTHTYPEFGSPVTKNVSIRFVVYSGINCVNTFTRNVTLLATPTLQFNTISPRCSDAPAFQVTQVQLINGLTGSGVLSGPGILPGGMFNPLLAGSGIHTLQYVFTGTNGCINIKTQTVEVNPTPYVNAGPDKVVLEGGVVTLTPALNAGISATYTWSPPVGLNNPNIASPVASPSEDITYTLTVRSDKGCTSTDQVFVKVLKSVVIPNVFSPNSDGINDTWIIKYLESYPGSTINVYNRYGQIIFHSTGYNNPWDGTYKGKPVPAGTYYFIVDPKNGKKPIAGFVDVLR